MTDKAAAPSFVACLAAGGIALTVEALAAAVSAACSVGVLLVYWYYKRKSYKLDERALELQQRDEHSDVYNQVDPNLKH